MLTIGLPLIMQAKLVLLADDESLIRLLLQPHLERAGYRTITAENGRAAVELAVRELPAIIILDVMMPEMDGLSALRQLKANEATRAIPVIVITFNENPASQLEARNAGAASFLTKPFSPAQLLAELSRLLPI